MKLYNSGLFVFDHHSKIQVLVFGRALFKFKEKRVTLEVLFQIFPIDYLQLFVLTPHHNLKY